MNKQRKSAKSVIIIFIVAIFLATTMTVSATGSVNIGIYASKQSVMQGEEVVVTVEIEEMSGVTGGIVAYTVQIEYDKTKFDFKPDSEHTNASGSLTVSDNSTQGVLSILYIDQYLNGISNPVTEGDLFSVIFVAKSALGSGISFVVSGADGEDDFSDDSTSYPAWKVNAIYSNPSVQVDIVEPSVNAITWTSLPAKTVYLIGRTEHMTGEDLDLSGGMITIGYDNGTTQDFLLTDQSITITGYDKNSQTTGTQTQTVSVRHANSDQVLEFSVRVLKLGDVNNDGSINSTDALSVLRHEAQLISLNEEQKMAADVNRDGKIDSSDALGIQRYEAQLINGFH